MASLTDRERVTRISRPTLRSTIVKHVHRGEAPDEGGPECSARQHPQGFEIDAPTTRSINADAVLVFVRNRAKLEKHQATAIDQARADRLAWIAYPKAGKLATDLNRDILWQLLQGTGVRPVRQVALDETWSALRFRPGMLSAGG